MFSWFKSKAKPANAAAPITTSGLQVGLDVARAIPAAVATSTTPQPLAPPTKSVVAEASVAAAIADTPCASVAAIAPLRRVKSATTRAKPQLMVLNRTANTPVYGARKPQPVRSRIHA